MKKNIFVNILCSHIMKIQFMRVSAWDLVTFLWSWVIKCFVQKEKCEMPHYLHQVLYPELTFYRVKCLLVIIQVAYLSNHTPEMKEEKPKIRGCQAQRWACWATISLLMFLCVATRLITLMLKLFHYIRFTLGLVTWASSPPSTAFRATLLSCVSTCNTCKHVGCIFNPTYVYFVIYSTQ